MFFKNNDQKKLKLGTLENEILDLQGKKREMEIELQNKKLDMQNERREQDMALDQERHKHRLEQEKKDVEFQRKKDEWAYEKNKMLKEHETEQANLKAELEKKAEMEMLEQSTMSKLKTEQQIAKAHFEAQKSVIEKDHEISQLKRQHAEELATLKSDLSKEHYDDLRNNLEKFHTEGNATTKFVQDLSMQMLKNRPQHDVSVGVDVNNQPKALEAEVGKGE